ncbi:MAG: zinc-dependent metalloprotease, partial [Abditibacteriales bacterium]|nr:zinc-dependent metalloprotease [Abditibacteriales bacterium]MDW8368515.1 zinc-dependent metalloprotease [Abditibacteriales bacterium]
GASNVLSILGLTVGNAPLADPRSVPLTVNYNLFFLPQNNYRPRLADPRVGYFVAQRQDVTEDKEEQMKRFILRWHLEKQDPTAPLSPPKEPIVFWLDHAIPEEYREAVKRGLLLWNKAFEKIGIKDAIVVKQMPDDADWDHADMRYNVIRWVSSEANGYAVALFRANPLTGQILNASITVDANITRFNKIEFQRMVDPLIGMRGSSADMPSAPSAGWKPTLRHRCTYAQEALPQAWLGWTAMNFLAGAKGTKVSEKQYVEDFLTSIVAHEMGHILGLRHNFIASTLNDMKQLADGTRVRQVGVVSSVMDYIPFNQAALHSPNNAYWMTTIGPYDYWAIEYGYTPIEASSPEAEKEKLKAIACKVNQPGHAYMSDEVADSFDPLITRFDLGKDPLEYWTRLLQDVRALLHHLPTRIPKKGENYWQFTRHFNGLLSMYGQAASIIARYVGGLHLRGNHRGDPG